MIEKETIDIKAKNVQVCTRYKFYETNTILYRNSYMLSIYKIDDDYIIDIDSIYTEFKIEDIVFIIKDNIQYFPENLIKKTLYYISFYDSQKIAISDKNYYLTLYK